MNTHNKQSIVNGNILGFPIYTQYGSIDYVPQRVLGTNLRLLQESNVA